MLGLLHCLADLASLRFQKRTVKRIERPYRAPAESDHPGDNMGTWFWANIPLALLLFCCWAGIPLWLTFTRCSRQQWPGLCRSY